MTGTPGCSGKRAEPQEPHAGRRACLGPSRALCGGGAIPAPAAVLMGLAQRPALQRLLAGLQPSHREEPELQHKPR